MRELGGSEVTFQEQLARLGELDRNELFLLSETLKVIEQARSDRKKYHKGATVWANQNMRCMNGEVNKNTQGIVIAVDTYTFDVQFDNGVLMQCQAGHLRSFGKSRG